MLLRSPPHYRASLLRMLNFIKFGRQALSLRSLYKVYVGLDRVKKKYDIVHCHLDRTAIWQFCSNKRVFSRAKWCNIFGMVAGGDGRRGP
jgi:hypothetical protein